MPVFQSQELLSELEARVEAVRKEAQSFAQIDSAKQRQRPATDGWSIVEVLHHLNYYAGYYLPAMEDAMTKQAGKSSQTNFKSGWLGNYFTGIIGPAEENAELKMKMSSPPAAVPPLPSTLAPEEELKIYLAHQEHLLKLLQQARHRNLGTIRVPITLSKWIRLKLGDTLRFVIAHQERHHQQIARLIS